MSPLYRLSAPNPLPSTAHRVWCLLNEAQVRLRRNKWAGKGRQNCCLLEARVTESLRQLWMKLGYLAAHQTQHSPFK